MQGTGSGEQNPKDSDQQPVVSGRPKRSKPPPKPGRIAATGAIALIAAGGSAWLMRTPEIHCDVLAPLTVLATLAAFLISICFRQMGRYPDKRSRWLLFVCLLIAAGTLFADFRYVRKYRDFCDQLQQQIRQNR